MADYRTPGPYDQYRSSPPQGVSQTEWDAYIDQQNAAAVAGANLPQGARAATNWVGQTLGQSPAPPIKTAAQLAEEAGRQFNKPVTPQSVQSAWISNQISDQQARDAANRNRLTNNLEGEINNANFIDQNAIGSLTSAQDRARAGYQGVAASQRATSDGYNAMAGQLFGDYSRGQNALNQFDAGAYGNYINETNPLMTQLQARGSNPADVARQTSAYNMASGIAGGSLDYTAAQYQSNPADVARQQQMYNTLLGVGQGSLNYQADQYESSYADMARQLQGYNDMRDIGQGSLDYKSKAALAYADESALSEQALALSAIKADLRNGGDEQREVLEKFKGLSDPEVTAKERFLSELARREFEAGDRSSRAAVSESLANRGLRSGGQQNALTASTRSQLSQDRLLKELGIQAQAVDRSMQALGGWGNAANSLRAGDQNALGMYGNMSTAMRNASFDEAYKRGLGADAASANNQQTRFAGYAGSVNQSNAIRNANDQVGMFNTHENNVAYANNQNTQMQGYMGAANQSNAIRNANDAVGTFNVGQTNQARANNQTTRMNGAQLTALQSNAIRSANDSMSQFQDIYAQNEATRVGNLSGQRLQGGLSTSANISNRNTQTFDAGRGVINDSYGRSSDANRADWDVVGKDYGMSQDYFDAVTGAGQNRVNRANTLGQTSSVMSAQTSAELERALGIRQGQWALEREESIAGDGY